MKPSDFYISLLDFFAVLLPGAIATALLKPLLGKQVGDLLVSIPDLKSAQSAGDWVIFLVCAYFVGHLIFLTGSLVVDPVYNRVRQKLHPYGNESAYQCAMRVRDICIDSTERHALNTFQWSRSVLIATSPAAAQDVHRLEADSKFFRSLIVLCLVGALVCPFPPNQNWQGAMIALALLFPCAIRYYERRLKSTTQAYIHVATLYRLGLIRQQQ